MTGSFENHAQIAEARARHLEQQIADRPEASPSEHAAMAEARYIAALLRHGGTYEEARAQCAESRTEVINA